MYILAIRTSKTMKCSPKYIRKRCYKNFVPSRFISEVRKIKWLGIYLSEDVNKAVEYFTNEINRILDVMAPLKTIQIRKQYNPWISSETKDMMTERDRLHAAACLNGE